MNKAISSTTEQRMVLATINFVGTMLKNGKRIYYREKYLTWKTAKAYGHCEDCKAEIAPGSMVAIGWAWFKRFCPKCVAMMAEKEAHIFSQFREPDPDTEMRLRSQKFGMAVGREFNCALEQDNERQAERMAE